MHSPTSFLIHGRRDFIINSGGKKIQPEPIEQVLPELLPQHSCIVCGLPDPVLGEAVSLISEQLLQMPWPQLYTILAQRLTKNIMCLRQHIVLMHFLAAKQGKFNGKKLKNSPKKKCETVKIRQNNYTVDLGRFIRKTQKNSKI